MYLSLICGVILNRAQLYQCCSTRKPSPPQRPQARHAHEEGPNLCKYVGTEAGSPGGSADGCIQHPEGGFGLRALQELGEKVSDPLSMYLSDIYTIPANLAGVPAISVPCGFSKSGLPVGLQLMGKAFDEEMLLRVSYTYEQNTEWHLKKPKLD